MTSRLQSSEKEARSAARFLERANAHSETIDEKWAASNEQWWDWYLSPAHNEGPFELGELSFHPSRCLHTAGPNRTTLPRVVFSTIYFEDKAPLIDSPTLISRDSEKLVPGKEPGYPITSDLNAALYSAASEPVRG